MKNKPLYTLYLLLFCFFLFFDVTQASGQSDHQSAIDEIRKLAAETLGADKQGDFYAGLLNFSIHPDISTATYNIKVENEGADDPTLKVYRLPLQRVFAMEDHNWRPLIRANFAYMTADTSFHVYELGSIDADWKNYGGSLSLGAEMPLSKNLTLIPAITTGIQRFESDADYHGVQLETIVKPALDGLVFNWDADTYLLGASLGLEYKHGFKRFDLYLQGSLTHNYIETFESSSDLIEFSSQITTLDINVESVIPTNMTISIFPVALVVNIGNTNLYGSDIDFDNFFETGLALETDISQKDWILLKKLRLGGKVIYGENVTGWSFIFGYRF